VKVSHKHKDFVNGKRNAMANIFFTNCNANGIDSCVTHLCILSFMNNKQWWVFWW